MRKIERLEFPAFPCLKLKRGVTNEECEACPCSEDKTLSIVDDIKCPWSEEVGTEEWFKADKEWRAYRRKSRFVSSGREFCKIDCPRAVYMHDNKNLDLMERLTSAPKCTCDD